MEAFVAVIALAVAIWQLNLQRNEIRRNGRISSLIHMASMLKDKIDYHEKMIDSMKAAKKDWAGHAARVNKELRPALNNVNQNLMDLIANQNPSFDVVSVRKALKLTEATETADTSTATAAQPAQTQAAQA